MWTGHSQQSFWEKSVLKADKLVGKFKDKKGQGLEGNYNVLVGGELVLNKCWYQWELIC